MGMLAKTLYIYYSWKQTHYILPYIRTYIYFINKHVTLSTATRLCTLHSMFKALKKWLAIVKKVICTGCPLMSSMTFFASYGHIL